jgi:hypothetical protein
VESLINELASSVWEREQDPEREYPPSSSALEDGGSCEAGEQLANNENGIMVSTTAARPRVRIRARALPRVVSPAVYRHIPRRLTAETDLSLQADDAALAAMEAQPAPPYPRPVIQNPTPLPATALVIAAVLGTGIMLISLWLLTVAP